MNCVTFLRGFLWLINTRTEPEKLPHLWIHDMYLSKSSTGWRKIEKNQTRKRRFFLWRSVREIWVVAPVDSFHPYWVNATVQRGKRKGSRIQMHGCEETRNQWFWTKGGGGWKRFRLQRQSLYGSDVAERASPSPKSIESEEKRALCWRGKNIERRGKFQSEIDNWAD